jgi:hypothetical protein
MPQYIYMLREREFIASNQDIYKIGRSEQENCIRVVKYPKSSELISKNSCFDCLEMENYLIKLFKNKYIQRTDIGAEYFEGNVTQMQNDICMTIVNDSYHRSIQNLTIPNSKKIKSSKKPKKRTKIRKTTNPNDAVETPISVITDVIETPIPTTDVVEFPIPENTPVDETSILPVIADVMKDEGFCNICMFSAGKKFCMEIHLESKRHIERVKFFEESEKQAEEDMTELRMKIAELKIKKRQWRGDINYHERVSLIRVLYDLENMVV